MRISENTFSMQSHTFTALIDPEPDWHVVSHASSITIEACAHRNSKGFRAIKLSVGKSHINFTNEETTGSFGTMYRQGVQAVIDVLTMALTKDTEIEACPEENATGEPGIGEC